jgi:hypothetical protein
VGRHPRDGWSFDAVAGWLSPLRVWLVLGGIGLLLLAALTPPFENPDEQHHFFQAYRLSEGRATPDRLGGRIGWWLPDSIPAVSARYLGSDAVDPGIRHRTASVAERLEDLKRPLHPDRRSLHPVANVYFPTGYAPQAAGIWLGRQLGLGPLGLLYAARVANALFGLALVALALRLLPTGAPVALSLALLPGAMQGFASASADALTVGGGFVLASAAMRATLGLSHGRLAALAVAAVGLGKYAYLPMGLSALGGRRRAVLLALVAAAAVVVALWVKSNSVAFQSVRPGVDFAGQVAFVAAHPLNFLAAAAVTLTLGGAGLGRGFLGTLGWGTLLLPPPVYGLLGMGLLLSLFAAMPAVQLPRRTLATWAVLGLGTGLVIMLAMYINWTPVGSPVVLGVQGRYFLPIAPLMACGLAARLSAVPLSEFRSPAYLATVAIAAAGCVAMLATALAGFHVLG